MRTSSRVPADKIELKVFGPLAGLMALLVAASFAALLVGAHQADVAAQSREERLVSNGIAAKLRETENAVAAEVVWDEAVRNLDNRFDPAWAEANIGEYFATTAHFERAFVLNAANQPVYAMADDETTNPATTFRPFEATARRLTAKVRAGETARGAFPHSKPTKEMVSRPIAASEIARVGPQAAIVTAMLVQPDFGTAYPAGQRAPVVITAEFIDPALVKEFGNRFLLRDAHLHVGSPRKPDHAEASVVFKDVTGTPVAMLDWKPEQPGAVLLTRALPILGFAVVALFVLGVFQFTRGRNAAKSLVASEARAKHMAHHDALTGLPNRVLFTERLEMAVEQSRRGKTGVSVLCIDLDRFKEVNDTFGHQCGDELIVETANRLRSVCRKGETLARLGGDEFAIVHDGGGAGSAALASRILAAMTAPVTLSGAQWFVGASIGISVLSEEIIDGPEALRQADVALYRAKAEGRGQYSFFEPEMDSALKARRATERDLRSALKNNELRMVYQPQVGARGEVFGVEALLRWDHPVRGPISPAYFIPIAEECGLIDEIGMFTLYQAFTDSHRWPDLKVAVNVSARQLATGDFPERLADLLDETKAKAGQIELEITEGLLLGDDPATHGTLQRLRDMGFTLALDDFGTGYSSLAYLSRYPIDKIKIDRSFIANLGLDGEADSVVKAIIKLARALNLSIIAEGVETTDQRERLVAAGCSRVQGYLYSKPVSADEISGLAAEKLKAA